MSVLQHQGKYKWKWLLAAALTVLVAGQTAATFAGEVTGKVVAVFHEKVQLPDKKWADKVSVTVADCNAGNQFKTFHYTPGEVSEANYLSSNFRHLATSARHTEQMNQYMNVVNGHATIKFDDNSKNIQKTTYWGYNWACGQNLDSGASPVTRAPMQQPGGQIPDAQTPQSAEQTPDQGGSSVNPVGAINKLRRFGF